MRFSSADWVKPALRDSACWSHLVRNRAPRVYDSEKILPPPPPPYECTHSHRWSPPLSQTQPKMRSNFPHRAAATKAATASSSPSPPHHPTHLLHLPGLLLSGRGRRVVRWVHTVRPIVPAPSSAVPCHRRCLPHVHPMSAAISAGTLGSGASPRKPCKSLKPAPSPPSLVLLNKSL